MSEPLNILHILSGFDPGGWEGRIVRLMNLWGHSARHSLMIGNARKSGACQEIDADVDVTVLPDAPALNGRPTYAALSALARAMRGYDLVLTYNYGAVNAVMARRLFGRAMRLPPLIHHEDGFGADEVGRLSRTRNLYRRLALPGARALVVPSCQMATIGICSWNTAASRVHHIPNGIEVAAYARRPFPDAIPGLDKSNGRVVVGTVANLRAVKALTRLVRIAAPLREQIQLVIVGDGPEREAIQAEARRVGIEVLMPGHLPRPQDYVGLFDIFALTSDAEQFPLPLIEAMAAGLPVLSTDVGDIASMLSGSNRPYLFAAADESGLTRGLTALVADATLRARLGAANQQRAMDAFDERGMVQRYAQLYGTAARSSALVDAAPPPTAHRKTGAL
ncbi:MAG: glycosyltransferase [Sphingobium sp.]